MSYWIEGESGYDERWKLAFESDIKDTHEDEIADTLIRILDYCGLKGIDIEAHVKLKLKYNSMRAHSMAKRINSPGRASQPINTTHPMYAKLHPATRTEKVAFVTFAARKLTAMQKKYGKLLEVISGDEPLQPAAKRARCPR